MKMNLREQSQFSVLNDILANTENISHFTHVKYYSNGINLATRKEPAPFGFFKRVLFPKQSR